ncbi:PAS domain S-box protein [Bacillus solimangrovi]|uniref:Diguanylate cyclase n=1 Tax=Bacillus solimangrovi TaxID=1305675 RepID=A0A1E5LH19_9BACI|nr:PAS domain S-box protein [Bacillus solimangrovi]OEH93377.1 hypothetical protein BFG57_12035 [Bacillus solimangrovi]
MSYTGRVTLTGLIGIIISSYAMYNFMIYGRLDWYKLIGSGILVLIAWFFGKQYDRAQYYASRYRSNQDQLKAVLNHNADGIIIWDLEHTVLEVNQSFERMYGWSRDELIGTKLESMKREIVIDVEAKIKEVLEKGSIHYETKRIQKDGTEIYINATLSLIRNREEEPIWIVGIVRDITERKKVSQRLSENEERFRTLVENSPDAIFIHTGGRFVFANATAANMFEVESEQDFIGQDVLELVHPDEWEKVKTRIAETQETHKAALPLQEKLVKSSGETFFADVTTIPITYQGKQANQVICRDVTFRKMMEDKLRNSERQLRGITDNMMDMLAKVNNMLVFEYVTPSYERILGYKTSELIGRKVLDLIHPDDVDIVNYHISKGLHGNQSMKMEYRCKTAHGNYVWMESVRSLFYDEEGEFQGSIIVSRNIADRKEAEELVLKQERILQGVSEATRQLLTTLDHEKSINRALSMLGQTMNVDRVYIFEKHQFDQQKNVISLRFDWSRDTIEPISASNMFENYGYEGTSFEHWIIRLEKGDVISPVLTELPESWLNQIQLQEVRSLLLVPIFVNRAFWGFIGFDDYYGERRWTKNEKATLSATAVSIAGSIERHLQEKQLRQMLHENKQLAARMSALLTNLKAGVLVVDQAKAVTLVNEEFCNMFHIDKLIDSLIGTMSTKLFENLQHIFLEKEEFLSKVRQFYQEKKVIINEEIKLNDGRTFELDYIPIYIEDNYDGHLWYYRDISERKMNEQQLKETNEILRQLSSLDGLTNIANRRYFDEFLLSVWEQAINRHTPLSLIMFDIDQFKKYNDTYGHQQGDCCLKEIAKALRCTVEEVDKLVARYGGEEFVAVLPNTTSQQALQVAELIRSAIEGLQIAHEASTVTNVVTVSLGVADVIPTENLSPNDLIIRADKALYHSKNTGRNRVTAYTEDLELSLG